MSSWLTWAAGSLLAAFLFSAQAPAAAAAQEPPCAERAQGLALLAESYGERPLWQGVDAGSGALLLLTLNLESGRWSLLVARPEAPALLCLAAAGSGGASAPPAPGEGS